MRTPLLLVISLVVVATGAAQPTDTAGEQITTTVNLIQLTAVVRDRNGRPVQDLTAEDFVVKDQGRVQETRLFEAVGASDPRSTLPGAEGDDQGTAETQQEHPRLRRRGEVGEGSQVRHTIILFQPLGFQSRHYAIRATRRFLRRKAPTKDRIAIIDGRRVVQPFTDDLERCLGALDDISGRFPQTERHAYGGWYVPTIELMRQLAKTPGRKAMVIFTDFDTRITGFAIEWWIRDALEANVALYPVDARGLETIIPFGDASTERPFFPSEGEPLLSVFAGPWVAGETMARLSHFAAGESLLASAAAATGGRYLANNNDLASIFDIMEADFDFYYGLGYYLNDLAADGKFHRITVEVKRPGLRVMAKSGYFAPKSFARLSDQEKFPFLYEALLTERPFYDIQVVAGIHVFPEPKDPRLEVPITCELQWSYPADKADLKEQAVALLGMIWDEATGREAGAFTDVRRWLPSKWHVEGGDHALRTARYNLISRLPPGNYRLKVVAADLQTNMLGSATFRFDISAPQKDPFAISSLVLADGRLTKDADTLDRLRAFQQSRGEGAQAAPDPLWLRDSRLLPNPSGDFRSDEKMFLFARIYPRRMRHSEFAAKWSATTRVRDKFGATVVGPFPIPMEDTRASASGIPLVYAYDFTKLGLKEGTYFAELQLSAPATGEQYTYRKRFGVDAPGDETPAAADREEPGEISPAVAGTGPRF